MDIQLPDHIKHLLDVYSCGSQSHKSERFVGAKLRIGLIEIQLIVSEYLPHKAEAIAMDSCGGDSDKDVPYFDLGSVNELALLDNTRGVTGDVIFPVLVHSRHLRGLTSDEGTPSLATTFRHSGNYSLNHFGTGLPLGHIVQEHKRFRTLGQHVIDAHSHGINTYCVVLVHSEGYLQFGTNAIGSAYQDRLLDIQCGEVEHPAESTDIAHNSQPRGRGDVLLDSSHNIVARFQANARLLVVNCHSIIELIITSHSRIPFHCHRRGDRRTCHLPDGPQPKRPWWPSCHALSGQWNTRI